MTLWPILPRTAALVTAGFVGVLGGFCPEEADAQQIRMEKVVEGLDEPWGLDFLPDGRFLVTEREGRLSVFSADSALRAEVSGLPDVVATGQGGLLDVMVPRDYATTGRIWLTYAAQVSGGVGTEAGFGRLSSDAAALEGFRAVVTPKGRRGGRHFGSRLVEAADGTVLVTTGDRGDGPLAQRFDGSEGKVLAFDREGQPKTHPAFQGADVFPGLFSVGHRNVQGATLDAQGRLWTVEHGARGGDELNLVTGGQNFGWPVITYGVDYSGASIGEGQRKSGMEQPQRYWDPSIAPSGLMIYSGKMFPGWRGHFFTGSLNSGFISRLDPEAGFAETRIESDETGRVRDIVEAPDGSIWFLSVIDGAVYRMVPG